MGVILLIGRLIVVSVSADEMEKNDQLFSMAQILIIYWQPLQTALIIGEKYFHDQLMHIRVFINPLLAAVK